MAVSRETQDTPRHLFRISTDQSNGTNSQYLLEPAVNTYRRFSDYTIDDDRQTTKEQLTAALNGNAAQKNPYIFTTRSFLFALQHAISKTYGAGHTNAHILCIDTRTCHNPVGEGVCFTRQ